MWGWADVFQALAWVREPVGVHGDHPGARMGQWIVRGVWSENLAEARSWRAGQATGQDQAGEVWSPPFHRQRQ